MVYSDHGCQAFSEPVVVTLQLTVVLPHVWANQGLVPPESIIALFGKVLEAQSELVLQARRSLSAFHQV